MYGRDRTAGDLLPSLSVTCLSRVLNTVRAVAATHVISFLDPSLPKERHPDLSQFACVHRKFVFYDQEAGPAMDFMRLNVQAFLDFLASVPDLGTTRMLFHCHAGASRSPAACYIALAYLTGSGHEEDAFSTLLTITRKPWPNLAMIAHADALLGRDGAMIRPVLSYRDRYPTRLAAYRRLNRRRGIVSPVSRQG
jgi:predicted protein tyrosine phosphatase